MDLLCLNTYGFKSPLALTAYYVFLLPLNRSHTLVSDDKGSTSYCAVSTQQFASNVHHQTETKTNTKQKQPKKKTPLSVVLFSVEI